MKIAILEVQDLGPSEERRWHELQDADPRLDNAFLSIEFARAVARQRPTSRVAVIQDDQRIVGFLPFEPGRRGLAQALGKGVSDAQGLIAEPGFDFNWTEFMARAQLSMIEFDHLAAWQSTAPRFHSRLVPAPVADITDGYAAYEAERRSVHKERFKGFDKKLRKLTREVGDPQFTFASHNDVHLKQMGEWKSAHYRRSGYHDIWGDGWYRDLVEELFSTDTPYLRGVLASLCIDDHPIALQLSLQSKNTVAGWVTTYDTEWATYSPGIELLRGILRSADTEHFTRYEFGKGDESFKQLFKTGDIEVANAWLGTASAAAVLRRAHKAPVERAEKFVLEHPAIRSRVRATLQSAQKLRNKNT